jgi:predicted DCC family thiol-disulfide oxidoreductase YuxK
LHFDVRIAAWHDQEAVYFDSDCGLCAHWAGRAARLLPSDRFRFMPLSSLDPPSSRNEMVVELPGGRLGGADAAMALAREIRWLLPISVLGQFPGVMPLLRCFYRILAANRYRIARTCLRTVCQLPIHREELAAPEPVTNANMMRKLRARFGWSFGLPAFRWMLEIGAFFLRTETELVMKSRRVVPCRLLSAGFKFDFPCFDAALGELALRPALR